MRDRLHVFDVILQTHEVAEAQHCKHLDGCFLLTDKFRLDLFQSKISRHPNDFAYKRPGQSSPTILRQHEHAHSANMSFPPSQLLMECSIADDLPIDLGQERQISMQINVLAPFL